MSYSVIALYKFAPLPAFKDLQKPLLDYCLQQKAKGTLLLAEEGINGTIASTREAIDNILKYLRTFPPLSDLEHKESIAEKMPFLRMKVRLKKEIVTMGVPDINPNKQAGTHVNPKDWNALISDPNVILVDTRNKYETAIGTFKNALDPQTNTFREFPKFANKHLQNKKNKKIAMFCTGGIRCEKSTAYLKKQGFSEVYHLKGGILKYLEEVPQEESFWKGECFVFDNRVAVKQNLEQGSYNQCYGCRYPITDEDKQSLQYLEGVHCPRCYTPENLQKHNRARQRQYQITLAKKRNQHHLVQNPKP